MVYYKQLSRCLLVRHAWSYSWNTNELRPGDFIPSEPQLSKQLGVSRTVVREGLRSLESLGVIGSRRGAGRYVRGFSLAPIVDNLSYGMLFDTEDMQEIIAVRERLEAGFIGEAIEAVGETTLNRLRDQIEKMREKTAAGQDFLEEDLAFHDAIYRVTGNRLLVKLLDVFEAVYHNLRDQSLFTPPRNWMRSCRITLRFWRPLRPRTPNWPDGA